MFYRYWDFKILNLLTLKHLSSYWLSSSLVSKVKIKKNISFILINQLGRMEYNILKWLVIFQLNKLALCFCKGKFFFDVIKKNYSHMTTNHNLRPKCASDLKVEENIPPFLLKKMRSVFYNFLIQATVWSQIVICCHTTISCVFSSIFGPLEINISVKFF